MSERDYDGMDFPLYDPWLERAFPVSEVLDEITLRDIHEGEEILDNYLEYVGLTDPELFGRNLAELKMMCAGAGVGSVKAYEGKL